MSTIAGNVEPGVEAASGAHRPPNAIRSNRVGVTLLLTAAMAALGAAPMLMPASYDWIEHGTSESAAQGIDGAWLARAGFILYGLGVLWLATLRRDAWGRLGTILHRGFGIGLFGVAAFAAKPWSEHTAYVESEDLLHGVSATIVGFSFIGGVVAVMVARCLPSVRAAAPDLLAVAITSVIPMMMSSSLWGLLQRAMFLTAAIWYGREAWATTKPSIPEWSSSAATTTGSES